MRSIALPCVMLLMGVNVALAGLKPVAPKNVNLSGLWQINPELSDDVQQVLAKKREQGMSARRGRGGPGGGMGRGGGAPDGGWGGMGRGGGSDDWPSGSGDGGPNGSGGPGGRGGHRGGDRDSDDEGASSVNCGNTGNSGGGTSNGDGSSNGGSSGSSSRGNSSGGNGTGGNGGSGPECRESHGAIEDMLATQEQLDIKQEASLMTFASVEQTSTCKAGEAAQVSMPDGNLADRQCGWKSNKFILELTTSLGLTRTDQYELAKGGNQLIVLTELKGGRGPMKGLKIKRTYDRIMAH